MSHDANYFYAVSTNHHKCATITHSYFISPIVIRLDRQKNYRNSGQMPMSLLSYNQLVELVKHNVIDAPLENINGSSIDITLGNNILVEVERPTLIDFTQREKIHTRIKNIDRGYALKPGEFVLATSAEMFNLPRHISAEYKLKSTMARNGLEHLNAGWCDAGWQQSRLTLELKNMTRYHTVWLTPGMKIGQIVFFEHRPVPMSKSYETTGQYNNQTTVTGSKGLR